MVNYVYINAVGASVITASTVLASLYLMVELFRQGRGKLRVKLLMGMVFSDLMFGIVTFPPEINYLAGGQLITGTARCKYPLSRYTTMLERYHWVAWPVIWGISFLHAGIWWGAAGFSSTKNLCYYKSKDIGHGLDARDLVQFVPRALVFLVVLVLYSRLFKFLRRPDTVQLSTQYFPPSTNGEALPQLNVPQSSSKLGPLLRLARLGSGASKADSNTSKENDAPWEQMEFASDHYLRATPQQSIFTAQPPSLPGSGILLSKASTPYHSSLSLQGDPIKFDLETRSRQTSISIAAGDPTPHLQYHLNDKSKVPALPTALPLHPLTPVLSHGVSESNESSSFKEDSDKEPEMMDEGRRPSALSMREFFSEPVSDRGEVEFGPGAGTNGHQMSAATYFNRQASLLMLYFPLAVSSCVQHNTATALRLVEQYLAVFSISLVRLVDDMVTKNANPVLTLISGWMVLSVGLIDALVYGVAEWVVRRRVRRKMPDRI
ncbi:hypothetical protein P7C73_g4483, partial [Tremellales sp. Uapishka_1]